MNCEGGVEETITWLSIRLQTISAEICGEVSALKWSSISSDGVFLSQNSLYYAKGKDCEWRTTGEL